jgi:hypothetical protein
MKNVFLSVALIVTIPLIGEEYEDEIRAIDASKAKILDGETHNGTYYDYAEVNNRRDLKRELIERGGDLGYTTGNKRGKVVHYGKIKNVTLKRGQNLGVRVVGNGNMYNKDIRNNVDVENVDTNIFSRNGDTTRDCTNDRTIRNTHISNDTSVENSNLYDINVGVSNRCR